MFLMFEHDRRSPGTLQIVDAGKYGYLINRGFTFKNPHFHGGILKKLLLQLLLKLELGKTEPLELIEALSLKLWYPLSNSLSMKSEAR